MVRRSSIPQPASHSINDHPHRSSLQTQATIISNNLLSVSEHLSAHDDLLTSLVAYPGPNYPGYTQAGTLEQLLRTKLDPINEDWVARGRAAGTEKLPASAQGQENPTPNPSAAAAPAEDLLSESDLAKLWEWAPVEANQQARRRNWGGNFTLEEREAGVQNVVTGLQRQLEDDEEEEEEEEGEEDEDEMEIVGSQRKPGADVASHPTRPLEPAMPLAGILKYMTTGQMA